MHPIIKNLLTSSISIPRLRPLISWFFTTQVLYRALSKRGVQEYLETTHRLYILTVYGNPAVPTRVFSEGQQRMELSPRWIHSLPTSHSIKVDRKFIKARECGYWARPEDASWTQSLKCLSSSFQHPMLCNADDLLRPGVLDQQLTVRWQLVRKAKDQELGSTLRYWCMKRNIKSGIQPSRPWILIRMWPNWTNQKLNFCNVYPLIQILATPPQFRDSAFSLHGSNNLFSPHFHLTKAMGREVNLRV